MLLNAPENLTPRESIQMEYEKAENEALRAYYLESKRLEIEVLKLETKWGALLRIPLTIIKLPVFLLMGIAYIFCAITKHEPSSSFWKFLGVTNTNEPPKPQPPVEV